MIDLKKTIKEAQETLNEAKTFNRRQITIFGCSAEISRAIIAEIFDGKEENPMSMEMTIAVASALEVAKQTLLEPFSEQEE